MAHYDHNPVKFLYGFTTVTIFSQFLVTSHILYVDQDTNKVFSYYDDLQLSELKRCIKYNGGITPTTRGGFSDDHGCIGLCYEFEVASILCKLNVVSSSLMIKHATSAILKSDTGTLKLGTLKLEFDLCNSVRYDLAKASPIVSKVLYALS